MLRKIVTYKNCFPVLHSFPNHHAPSYLISNISSSKNEQSTQTSKQSKSFLNSPFFQKYFGPQANTASPNFKKRWLMVIPCFLSNLCIGAPYAWSMVAGLILLC